MSQTPAVKPYFAHPQALVETEDIGLGTRIWAFAHVLPGARIGAECNICDHAFIETGVVLGNNVTIKNGVAIWQGVRVEDNVFLGPNCVLTNDPNPRAYIKKPGAALQTTLIRANATVGANATILCGVTIGRYAFIGAGAVVLRTVLDFALMVGNPARQIGWMCHCARRLPILASASLNSSTTCPYCQAQFRATPTGLTMVEGCFS
ncbi:MAG TPA: acyltransferase [Candidatus Acidoferrales bacterium]|jgi:UDP-2-acetamido-3-amino-2,3-dideoxy-glucuronate N-acetyltransferase|nr:acyltransferase [Candidatus Acidoferrales bacterium]